MTAIKLLLVTVIAAIGIVGLLTVVFLVAEGLIGLAYLGTHL